MHEIYEAIKRSARPDGSNALNTMLLITFDEHGGTYDHVRHRPRRRRRRRTGRDGFHLRPARMPRARDRRVGLHAAGTIIHDEMHHGAVIATLSRLHGLKPLTRRDPDANDLFNAVNLDAPASVSWPSTTPQYIPPNPQTEAPHPGHAHKDKPLSPPARGLLGLLLAKYGSPDDQEPETYADAYELLHRYGVGLFGKRFVAVEARRHPDRIG